MKYKREERKISQLEFHTVNFTNCLNRHGFNDLTLKKNKSPMKSQSLMRQSHFLGTKIRNLRKKNRLTMEDLSSRCIKINPELAPSVSYLSMIERGKRVPSIEVLELIASIFQKNVDWFLDDAQETDALVPIKRGGGGISGMALEPSFLFTKEMLQIAIPELLNQTGVTGRQFGQLLIRAHQEHYQNHFPDLERAAEDVGLKRMPLSVQELFKITAQQGLDIKWFKKLSDIDKSNLSVNSNMTVTSFFEPPNVIYLNEALKSQPKRLKYDLAVHIGHCVLHNRDGMRREIISGRNPGPSALDTGYHSSSSSVEPQDIVQAWRDFECSFFAGALLCPKIPFRHVLDREGYEVKVHQFVDVTESVAMRRMTAVSPYPYWHYFDVYQPGVLKAVYRGNGIPLPWGNMRLMEDPCQNWAVFRMLNSTENKSFAQISILRKDGEPRIYCCESRKVKDFSGQVHAICAGVDLNPALDAQGKDSIMIAKELESLYLTGHDPSTIPHALSKELLSVGKILNINWVERGVKNGVRLICSREQECSNRSFCKAK